MPLTDIHCHLLPGIDDGARNIEISLQLLEAEYNSGVRQIVFTTHFDCEKTDLDLFLDKRKRAFDSVLETIKREHPEWDDLQLGLGAEVKYSPNLPELPLEQLCLGQTRFLLLELPFHMFPAYFESTIRQIIMSGITPILAHIERYSYVLSDPPVLCDWIDEGVLMQMNAETFLQKDKDTKLCLNLVKWNLVHVIASDAHSLHRRPVNLKEGLAVIEEKLGNQIKETLIQNSNHIFMDEDPEESEMYCPRKIFGRWR